MKASICSRHTANAEQANFGEAWQIGQNARSELTFGYFRIEGGAKAWEQALSDRGAT